MRFIFLFFLLPLVTFALEVDEKLTVRIIKLSESKKTILINRGSEDGLVVGDQAKFLDQSGVVGRGVVEKVSPTRSVWSIYSVVNAGEMVPEKVLNIKITDPLKLTGDETKELNEKDLTVEAPKMEPSAPTKVETKTEKKSTEVIIRNLETKQDAKGQGRSLLERSTWELVGGFNFNSQTFSVDLGRGTADNSITQLTLNLSVEKYFQTTQTFWRKFSFLVGLDYQSYSFDENNFREGSVPNDLFGLGFGINYHLFNDPFVSDGLIPFLSLGVGFGSRTFTLVDGGTAYVEDTDLFYWNIGLGAKFFTLSGWGFRFAFDYYSQSMSGKTPIYGMNPDITASGPRIWIGMSYRF
ncbi:MAG: hypothetical protein ACHQYQ_01570 [Bacteriovoracales bacterium]